MEVINLEAESNNPNLDGDFKTLLEIQKKKKESGQTGKTAALKHKEDQAIIEEEEALQPGSIPRSEPGVSTDDGAAQTTVTNKLNHIYPKLMKAVKNDDTMACKDICIEIHEAGKALGDPQLRDPENGATALHFALENDCKNIAKFFIQYSNEEFVMDEYEIVIRKMPSRKTCLHILVEKGDLSLTKELLSKISEGNRKQEYLRRYVLTEMEGQRPRELSAIHLAALHGHVELVDLLVHMKVSVNTTNNKNDTPVLWAARGNHIEMVRTLIKHGADLKTENDKGSTPLYWAVRYGFTEMTRVLITEGKADVNQRRKLGLVLPIVLASALGHADIVKILLEHGANAKAKINGGQSALHYAAAVGNEGVVTILMDSGISVDEPDDMGNTALMAAVKAGNLNVLSQLILAQANTSAKNKFGETVWDFAMEHNDEKLLEKIIQLYRQTRRMKGKRTIFPVGKNPLHVAALKGDVKKLRCLIDLGADPKCVDSSGNTYYHYAARDNCTDVLREFLGDVDVNQQNTSKETPLHLAVNNGNTEAVKIILKKSKLDIKNCEGATPLHIACGSYLASPEIVNVLVESIVKTNNWSLVDAPDNMGNTALHIACKKGRADLMEELSPLNPNLKNKDGNSPLHTAALSGKPLEEILQVFNKPGKGLNIDQQNAEGETVLHICAKRGDTESVKLLIESGCDLSVKNKEGNTVLHELVEQTVLEPANKENLVAVYQTITDCAALWWCMREDLHVPEEDSEPYLKMRRDALLYLTSDVYNNRAMNAPVFAAFVGATTMLQAIMETKNVRTFKAPHGITYDVTDLAPETVPAKVKKRKVSKYSNSAVVGAIDESDIEKHVGLESCLDIIIRMENEVLATKILDLNPIKQLVANYWRAYQWIYGLLMVLHIVYMGCFSVYSMPYLAQTTTNVTTINTPTGMALFLLWPGLLLIFELYYFIVSLYRFCKDYRKARDLNLEEDGCKCNLMHLPAALLGGLFSHLHHFTSLIFSISIVVWFVLYATDAGGVTAYVVAVALILGWLFTITFIKGFENVQAFSIMLKYIIIRDITRFMVIYIFILLAFSLALHALIQIVPDVAQEYPTSWDSIFMTFNMMVGMDDLFGGEYDAGFTNAGVSPLFAKIVYIAYIILATIILLNLLIAMMSDTYNGIKKREGTTWRVGSVRLALQIERSVPFLKMFFKSVGAIRDRIKRDPDTNRFMMTLSLDEVRTDKDAVEVNELVKAMFRMEAKIDQLKTNYSQLCEEVFVIADRQESLLHNASAAGDAARTRRPSVLQTASPRKDGRPTLRPRSSKSSRSLLIR